MQETKLSMLTKLSNDAANTSPDEDDNPSQMHSTKRILYDGDAL